MDTVNGSRKYFQNSGIDNNYYRNSMNRSFLQTNYSSYQNTLGRSSLGPFAQSTCSIPYQNDVSLHSQYGYNSWGMWKDSRNLTPSSSYSSKSNRRSVRSFTILLMTAVFIVMIAIFGFAALAFYFSTYKADTNDSMMVFDGKFQVLKGDTFTTGLKYNHTSVFQQKAEQYQGMIVKSLEKSGMELLKCSVLGFGDGPLINVMFRIIVDMRKIPLTIKSVEDHIKESIAKEALSKKTVFNHISVDMDSINIQRLLDNEVLKSSSFINVETTSHSSTTSHSEPFDATKVADRVINKATTTVRTKLQTKIDKTDMPIQGSFEVTKTDADIAQKKSPPTTTKTSTLRPFTISNTGMRIKTKKTTIEKVKNPTLQSAGISHVNKVTIESITDMTKKENPTSTSRPLTTMETKTVPTANMTTASKATNATENITAFIDVSSKFGIPTVSSTPFPDSFQRRTNIENPPKLDANLFTTAPVIDDEPWLPINPINPVNPIDAINPTHNNYGTVVTKVVNVQPTDDADNENGDFQFHILPRNKIRFSEPFDDSFNQEMLFHSFTNPAFTYLTPGIETLGSANLRPYPIPVNKIVDEPDSTEPATPELIHPSKKEGENSDGLKSAKNVTRNEATSEANSFSNIDHSIISPATITTTEATALLGDVLLDLLGGKVDTNNKDIQPLTTVLPDTTTSINFKNIKEFVLTAAKNNSSSTSINVAQNQPSKVFVTKKQPNPSTSTLRNFPENGTVSIKPTSYIEVETVQYTPVSESWNQPSLFPVQSKFEYINGSLVSSFDTQTIRRIFNETLHAWIVENSQKAKVNENDEIFARKNNSQIQNISAIFDTLASELGVQPNISTKIPPFVTSPYNKKTTHGIIDNRQKQDNKRNNYFSPPTTFRSSTDKYVPPKSDITGYGEAEIEEVDPTQYEQILLSNIPVTSTTVPSLVTLMPVKSNSGIRQRTPIIDKFKISLNSRSRREQI